LYCLNYGKNISDETVSYELLGVSTSEAILELVNLLAFKKVNYEHYLYYPETNFSYDEVKDKLQEILWKITNGEGLDATDIAYIESLSMLPMGVFPEYIYDLEIALPDCWCVDECDVVRNSGALSYVLFDIGCTNSAPTTEIDGNGKYTTNGFSFNVETNANKNPGVIKFEESGMQLGEDGRIEIGTFIFTASCYNEHVVVITKNMDEITTNININKIGESVLLSNGFMVEFVSVVGDLEEGFTYIFNVVSDRCEGGQTK